MPLELVTGPANSEKAGHVLGGVRVSAQAGEEPLLVVPRRPDVDAYRRELAGEEVALGVGVTDFAGLLREMARRATVGGRSLGERARERVAAVVAVEQASRLRTLAAAAGTEGFPRALTRLSAELSAARCDPRRFALAMTIWGRAERREQFAADLAALYGAYAGRLERLGARDPDEHAWAVLDALRLAPSAWGTTPVFLYGFDDLTDVQLDAVRTLAGNVGARGRRLPAVRGAGRVRRPPAHVARPLRDRRDAARRAPGQRRALRARGARGAARARTRVVRGRSAARRPGLGDRAARGRRPARRARADRRARAAPDRRRHRARGHRRGAARRAHGGAARGRGLRRRGDPGRPRGLDRADAHLAGTRRCWPCCAAPCSPEGPATCSSGCARPAGPDGAGGASTRSRRGFASAE